MVVGEGVNGHCYFLGFVSKLQERGMLEETHGFVMEKNPTNQNQKTETTKPQRKHHMAYWSGKGIETPRNIKSFFPWKLKKETRQITQEEGIRIQQSSTRYTNYKTFNHSTA